MSTNPKANIPNLNHFLNVSVFRGSKLPLNQVASSLYPATALLMTILVVSFVGCNSSQQAMNNDDATNEKVAKANSGKNGVNHGHGHDHDHEPGAHGGDIYPLGRESYHVEVVRGPGDLVQIYTLGSDETRVIDVEKREWMGFARRSSDRQAVDITFRPSPQPGDGQDRSSLFVAELPADWRQEEVQITIPNITIDGERFRLGFTLHDPIAHGDQDHAMQDHSAMFAESDEETIEELYSTPGGRYTAADIEANGKIPAAQKFRGIRSNHNMFPQTGDRLCPITMTKANSQFTWMVDGKPYEFCCPPCIDEFVRMAKEQEDELEDPSVYVK